MNELIKKTIGLITIMAIFIGLNIWKDEYEKSISAPLFKATWDEQVNEKYESIKRANYEVDLELIQSEEHASMTERIKTRVSDKDKEYWAIAKNEYAIQLKEIVEAYPEVASLVVESKEIDKVLSLDGYTLQGYIDDFYPTSRASEEMVLNACRKHDVGKEVCVRGIGIMIKESALDTDYAKKQDGRIVKDVEGGKAYNNLAGLKCSTALYKEGKNCNFPDGKGFYLTQFNSVESFLDYFYGHLMTVSYGKCETTQCFHPYYNTAQSWVDDVVKLEKLLLPITNY